MRKLFYALILLFTLVVFGVDKLDPNRDIDFTTKITGKLTATTFEADEIIFNGVTIESFSIDGSLTDNSDRIISTQKAIKTYIGILSVEVSEISSEAITIGISVELLETYKTLSGNSIETLESRADDADAEFILIGNSFEANRLRIESLESYETISGNSIETLENRVDNIDLELVEIGVSFETAKSRISDLETYKTLSGNSIETLESRVDNIDFELITIGVSFETVKTRVTDLEIFEATAGNSIEINESNIAVLSSEKYDKTGGTISGNVEIQGILTSKAVKLSGISESIKSLVTGTITAMSIYERNKDDVFSSNDPHKYWYKKADTSWYQELGEFPERALLVGADSLYVVDLDKQSVYMEFELSNTYQFMIGASAKLTSITMKNGILFVCSTPNDGARTVDFYKDSCTAYGSTNNLFLQKTISQRNTDWLANSNFIIGSSAIISLACNSIHANVVNGTLYCVVGTDGGLSQINMETGVVWDNTDTATNKKINRVKLSDDGKIYFSCQDSATETDYQKLYKRAILTADVSGYDTGSTEYSITAGTPAGIPIDTATAEINDFVIADSSLSESGQNKIVLGKDTKLTILHENSTPAKGWYQYKTPTYDTGLLYNDTAVVGCYLNGAYSVIADRSYRGNTLTNEGSVAISADVTAPFGVSADFNGTDQYLGQADITFAGANAFVFSGWFSFTDGQPLVLNNLLAEFTSASDGSVYCFLGTDGKINLGGLESSGLSFNNLESTFTFSNGQTAKVHILGLVSNGSYKLYINGILDASSTDNWKNDGVSTTGKFRIGASNSGGVPAGFMSGFISQIKLFNALPNDIDAWVKAEYELGRNTIGKTCLIQGNSAQVNSVSAIGDDVLISTGDGTFTGYVQTVSGGATILTIEATTNANNLVLASQDYTVYSAVTASALHLIRPDIDFLKYVQNLVYKPKETIFVKGSWASAGTSITVTNPYITNNSNIIAMPQSAPEGSWYLTGQAVGTVTINSLSTEAYSVDYLLMINN
jgi:hypothetical protein